MFFFFFFFPDCTRSSLLQKLFSSCGKQGLLSSCGGWASDCSGFSCCGAWALGCMGFSSCNSRALKHRLNNCSLVASGIFSNQGLNLCLLHWHAESLPLKHQESPLHSVVLNNIVVFPIHAKSLRDHKASQGSKSPSYFDPATSTKSVLLGWSRISHWHLSVSLRETHTRPVSNG